MLTESPQFTSATAPPEDATVFQYLFYQKGAVFVGQEDNQFLWGNIPLYFTEHIDIQEYMGELDGVPTYAVQLRAEDFTAYGSFKGLRSFISLLSYEWIMLVGYGVHLLYWADLHRYCGRCGGHTHSRGTERAKACSTCEAVYYPQIAPAVIVAVTKGDQILLAQPNRYNVKFYSVLAGFVEIGETFEQTVRREIKEEAGIELKNIQYFGSQPWPFPNSIMIGFTAEWASGELAHNPDELVDAGWFTVENMPPTPGMYSIAGRLIEWFIKEKGGSR